MDQQMGQLFQWHIEGSGANVYAYWKVIVCKVFKRLNGKVGLRSARTPSQLETYKLQTKVALALYQFDTKINSNEPWI